ncbi:MAG: MoaD/ThiS family protein [Methanolinea sp.]|nr:MoaD/ThiS family protein [Methanolinea sp.]
MKESVRVRAFARFRELFGGTIEMDLPWPATVRSVIRELEKINPAGLAELVDNEGNLKKSVILMINRERIMGPAREDCPLRPGDEIAFYPPVAGG